MTRATFVMVTSSYPMAADGREAAGSFVVDLAQELARSIPVRVVAPGIRTTVEEGGEHLQIYRYRAPAKPLSTLKPWHPRDLADLISVLANGQEATYAAVAAGSVARLLALWALPCGHWARRAARRHGIGYSAWTLGSDIWSLGRIPVVRNQLSRVLAQADVCYSDGLQLAHDTSRLGERDVEFLPSTRRIDSRRETPVRSAPPYRLLFLGRWHPNKGVDLLLRALHLLEDDDWSRVSEVTICGGGPLEPLVRSEVDALRASGRPVCLGGYLDKPAAEAAILEADYVLIPSRVESIPVVFSDAMKLGCPVVAMPVGDLPSLVGKTPPCGVLARQVSAPTYAEALRNALHAAPLSFANGVVSAAAPFDLGACARRLIGDLRPTNVEGSSQHHHKAVS